MSSAPPPTEYFPGINLNPSFYNLGSSAVSLDYLNSNFLRSTGYTISRAQFTLFNGSVDINENLDVSGNINASAYLVNNVPVSFSQWTTSNNDIYYNTGNVGIGKTNPSATYKLDVSGNINANKVFRDPRCCMRRYEGGQRWSPPTLKVGGDPAPFSIFLISWKRQSSI